MSAITILPNTASIGLDVISRNYIKIRVGMLSIFQRNRSTLIFIYSTLLLKRFVSTISLSVPFITNKLHGISNVSI